MNRANNFTSFFIFYLSTVCGQLAYNVKSIADVTAFYIQKFKLLQMQNRITTDEDLTSSRNIGNTMLAEALVHPILFSTPMVNAILEGRKRITRRIVKPQPIDNTEIDGNFFEGNHKGYVKVDNHPNWKNQFVHEFSDKQVGDILWVRETFGDDFLEINETGAINHYLYKADALERPADGWKPSIFMPKAACRIWLKITGVSIERLQDISSSDAENEGVDGVEWYERDYSGKPDYKTAFKILWSKINGVSSWNENPFVWVISFQRTDCPKGFC